MFIPDILENVFDGIGGGDDGVNTIGEIREGITGGCVGFLMSIAFFFFFFLTIIALFSGGITDYNFQFGALAFPFMAMLCVSGIASPFIGLMMGLKGGVYRFTQHIGCFIFYLVAVLGLMIAVSVLL